ncbi:MAG: hypothetical protein ACREJT_00965 [Myxococcota bacterium]
MNTEPLNGAALNAAPGGDIAGSAELTMPALRLAGFASQIALAGGGALFYDFAIGNVAKIVHERIGVAAEPVPTASMHGRLTDIAVMAGTVRALFHVVATEELDLVDESAPNVVRIAAIVEAIRVSAGLSSRVEASVVVAAIVALRDSSRNTDLVQALDAVAFDDDLETTISAHARLLEALLAQAEAQGIIDASAVATDTVEIADSPMPKAFVSTIITEVLGCDALLVIDGESYAAWVVNTETGAPSQYLNWTFNSMARLGQRYLGANDTGLYLLEGKDDAGEAIRARVRTGIYDFDTDRLSRVENAYIGYSSDGRVVLKTITSEGGKRTVNFYRSRECAVGTTRGGRFDFGKGLKSRFWQFELVNEDGADFDIDKITFNTLALSRRV